MSALPPHAPGGASPDAHTAAAPRADIVTASDLVRRFGLWQERAQRTPVYVLFRGRPRLVLTSIEVMEALLAPHLPDRDAPGLDAAALLDLIRDMVILADADLHVIAASRTARAYFGDAVAIGSAVGRIVPPPARPSLLRVLGQVQASGVAQTLDLPSPGDPGRRLNLVLQPHRRGVALLAWDTIPGKRDELSQD